MTTTMTSVRKQRRLIADINVTPMVDVMLVLLVVFMITAPMLTTGISVNLPKAVVTPLANTRERPLIVTVAKDGRVFIGMERTPTERAGLANQLRAIADLSAGKRVYVSGDGEARYEQVVSVLALLRAAGFANAGLLVDSGMTVGSTQSIDPETSRR